MIDIYKIAPQGKRCLVEGYKNATKTESGLELAERESDATPVMGVIIRTGTESTYKEGQHVLFRRYGIDELEFNVGADKVTVSLIEDEEILAIIEQ